MTMAAVKKVLFYIILLVIAWLGVMQGGSDRFFGINDLVLHFSGYVVFAGSGLAAYPRSPVKVSIFLFAYSVGIEVIQFFLPYRTFSLLDIAANLGGIATTAMLWWKITGNPGLNGKDSTRT